MQPEFTWVPHYSEHLYYSWATYYTSTFGFTETKWIEIHNSGGTVFTNNRAEGLGGAIYVEGSEISWSESMLLKHNSAQYGGALYLENYATVEANGPTAFYSNNALYNGGAIGAADDARTYSGHSWLIVNNSMNFTDNTCGANGGALDLSDIDVVDVYGKMMFSNNSAVASGGALYASNKEVGPLLTGVIFLNNTAESGGAVFLFAVGADDSYYSSDDSSSYYDSSSKFYGCRFDGNSASSTGGALHSIAGYDVVSGTSFTNNLANTGGALQISGTIVLVNSSFVENKSGEGGGAAISISGVNSMEELIFSGNGYHCSSDSFLDLNEVGFVSWSRRIFFECDISITARWNGRGMHRE